MTLLTKFTKEMLLRSSYGDERAATALAEKLLQFYSGHLDNPVCRSRYYSLKRIIRGFKWVAE